VLIDMALPDRHGAGLTKARRPLLGVRCRPTPGARASDTLAGSFAETPFDDHSNPTLRASPAAARQRPNLGSRATAPAASRTDMPLWRR
jgi:hypothetical protein